jgi:hypothetical protein
MSENKRECCAEYDKYNPPRRAWDPESCFFCYKRKLENPDDLIKENRALMHHLHVAETDLARNRRIVSQLKELIASLQNSLDCIEEEESDDSE